MPTPFTYGLTSDEYDVLTGVTNRLSAITLLTAGFRPDQTDLTQQEVHALFEEPWLALRAIVNRVNNDEAARIEGNRSTQTRS